MVYEVIEGRVESSTYRENTFSAHRMRLEQPGHDHQHGEHNHSHSAIVAGLSDCQMIISRGMGRRLYDDFQTAGIKPVITDVEDVNEAVMAYLSDKLVDHPEKGCQH